MVVLGATLRVLISQALALALAHALALASAPVLAMTLPLVLVVGRAWTKARACALVPVPGLTRALGTSSLPPPPQARRGQAQGSQGAARFGACKAVQFLGRQHYFSDHNFFLMKLLRLPIDLDYAQIG